MKALLFVLATASSLMPFAQAQAQATGEICGRVFISELCDVDYCRTGLAFTKADGTEDYYPLSNGGDHINRDYKITPELEAMNGGNFCASLPGPGQYGIEISTLRPQ